MQRFKPHLTILRSSVCLKKNLDTQTESLSNFQVNSSKGNVMECYPMCDLVLFIQF